MARGGSTMLKRQKEQRRQEKQQEKAKRRSERKLGEPVAGDETDLLSMDQEATSPAILSTLSDSSVDV